MVQRCALRRSRRPASFLRFSVRNHMPTMNRPSPPTTPERISITRSAAFRCGPGEAGDARSASPLCSPLRLENSLSLCPSGHRTGLRQDANRLASAATARFAGVSRQKIWDKIAGKLRETLMYYSLVSLIHTVSWIFLPPPFMRPRSSSDSGCRQ